MKTSTATLTLGTAAAAQSHVQAPVATAMSEAIGEANETILADIVKRNVATEKSVTAQKRAATKRKAKATAKVDAMKRRAALYGQGVVAKALDAQIEAKKGEVSAQAIATGALQAFIENGANDVENNGFVKVADALYADPTLRDDEGKTGPKSEAKLRYMVLANLLARANKALASGDNPIVEDGTRWAFNSKGGTRSLILKGVAAKRLHQPEAFLTDYRAAAKETDGHVSPASIDAIEGLRKAIEVLVYEQTGEHVAVSIKANAPTKRDTKMVGPHDVKTDHTA